jgi:hypothetical protein
MERTTTRTWCWCRLEVSTTEPWLAAMQLHAMLLCAAWTVACERRRGRRGRGCLWRLSRSQSRCHEVAVAMPGAGRPYAGCKCRRRGKEGS